mgnify:CR=1 FL=1
MTTPDQQLECSIVAAGSNIAPRITPADIEANIDHEVYFTASDGCVGCGMTAEQLLTPKSLQLLTFCVLVLRNGFTVTGESACASPANFNAEIGRRIARENAVAKITALMAEHGITADHLVAKPVAKANKPRRKKAEPKAGAVTYNINGTVYTQGQRGRVPAVVAAARDAGTLEQYRVAA